MEDDYARLSVPQLVRILTLGANLTKLSLDSCNFHIDIFEAILLLCPQLIELTCETYRAPPIRNDPPITQLIMPATMQSHLQYLRWPGCDGILDLDLIPRYCRQLKGLWIHSYQDQYFDTIALEQFMREILEHCQNLNQLIIDELCTIQDRDIRFDMHSSTTPGLKTLVYPPETMLTDSFICDTIKQNARTLEQLHVTAVAAELAGEPDTLSGTQFPCLQHLEICGHPDEGPTLLPFREPIHELILACPSLTSVRLSYMDITATLMDILSALQLHSLAFGECTDNEDAIFGYVQSEASKGKGSSLRRLAIYDMRYWSEEAYIPWDMGRLLPDLGRLSTLEILHLNSNDHDVQYSDVMSFAEAAKECYPQNKNMEVFIGGNPASVEILKASLPSTFKIHHGDRQSAP